MVTLALAPFGWGMALVSGLLGWAMISATAYFLSPKIALNDKALTVGRIQLPRSVLGKAELLQGADARFAKGPGLNPAAAHLIRGDIKGLVRVEILDPQDPTPYLIFSSRRASELVDLLSAS